nr:protein FAR1-RELATED SEQUENCE 5-like [Ipomoea trifida]
MNEVWNDFYSCVALAGDNSDRVSELSRILRELKLSFVDADSTLGSSVGKSGVLRSFGGVLASSEIVVQPPTVAKNKGSGKRYKTSKELAMEKAAQFTRECATCHKCNGHDSPYYGMCTSCFTPVQLRYSISRCALHAVPLCNYVTALYGVSSGFSEGAFCK